MTSVPTPGLAEEHDQALADYLSDMKANMTDDEINTMVEETAAFNAWNTEERPNNDFLISPEELPEPTTAHWTKTNVDGVTVYRGETELSGVGQYAIYFDLSGMSREEMEYLMLTSNYRMQMDTSDHSAEELYRLLSEYISGGNFGLCYPNSGAGENHRPMLSITWEGLTKDFDASLDLILEMYTQIDFSDLDMLSYLTKASADYWDMSRQDPGDIAYYYAHRGAGLSADTNRFMLDNFYESQGYLTTRIYSDPNVRATVEALDRMPQALYDMELTEENLNGYILKAYSDMTSPQGVLKDVMIAMVLDVYGADAERIHAITHGIKDVELSDQTEATKHIAATLEDANYCMVGNEGLIRADADCFDEVVSWRSGNTATRS